VRRQLERRKVRAQHVEAEQRFGFNRHFEKLLEEPRF
jgi:hypothetical protein